MDGYSKEIWMEVMNELPEEKLELGKYFTFQIKHNIKHLLFTLARYKFAVQMIGENPKKTILELGCNEGIGTLNLSQIALNTVAVDFDEDSIKYAQENLSSQKLSFIYDNFMEKKYGTFDFVVSLDVIEHIEKKEEDTFLSTIVNNLNPEGAVIIGTPNITANVYASKESQKGHINLYGYERLKELFLKYFKNVFLFGMNDELVHTGFLPMAHYLMVLACNKR